MSLSERFAQGTGIVQRTGDMVRPAANRTADTGALASDPGSVVPDDDKTGTVSRITRHKRGPEERQLGSLFYFRSWEAELEGLRSTATATQPTRRTHGRSWHAAPPPPH